MLPYCSVITHTKIFSLLLHPIVMCNFLWKEIACEKLVLIFERFFFHFYEQFFLIVALIFALFKGSWTLMSSCKAAEETTTGIFSILESSPEFTRVTHSQNTVLKHSAGEFCIKPHKTSPCPEPIPRTDTGQASVL